MLLEMLTQHTVLDCRLLGDKTKLWVKGVLQAVEVLCI